MNFRLILFFLAAIASTLSVLFFPFPSLATNLVTVLTNKIYYGLPDCALIRQSHIDKTFQTCSQPPAEKLTGLQAFDILKSVVFQKAQAIADQKKTCLADYSKKLQNAPAALNEFRQKLTALWLNRKKAEALLRQCKLIDAALPYADHSLPQDQGKDSLYLSEKEKNYLLKYHPDLKLKHYPTCRNPNQIKSLSSLIALTDAAAPFWSGKGIYQVLEKNRSLVISAKTGQPVTDEEILDFNANSNEMFVRPDPRKQQIFYQSVGSYFELKNKDRSKLLKEMESGFTESNMKILFEEGSAYEALDEIGLSEAKSEEDSDISRMHYCLRSHYEGNLAGDLIEAVVGAVLTKKVLPLSVVRVLSRAGKWAPESLAMFVGSLPQNIEICKSWKPSTLKINSKDEVAPSMNKSGLPKDFDVDLLMLKNLPLNSVASCVPLGLDRIYEKKASEGSCAMNALISILPIWPSLGASLVNIKMEP